MGKKAIENAIQSDPYTEYTANTQLTEDDAVGARRPSIKEKLEKLKLEKERLKK